MAKSFRLVNIKKTCFWIQNFRVVKLGIKHWSPSYADKRMNLIHLRYVVVISWKCRDDSSWAISDFLPNLYVHSLDIETEGSRIKLLQKKVPTSDCISESFIKTMKSNFNLKAFLKTIKLPFFQRSYFFFKKSSI